MVSDQMSAPVVAVVGFGRLSCDLGPLSGQSLEQQMCGPSPFVLAAPGRIGICLFLSFVFYLSVERSG